MAYLYIKPVNQTIEDFYKERANYSSDSGVDLYNIEDVHFYPGETKLVDLGIKCKMLNDSDNSIAYYLYPRSSIYKTPLRLANSVGIIDKDYRGNIMAPLQYIPNDNIIKNMPFTNSADREEYIKTQVYTLKKGQRIVQICSPDLSPIKIIITNQLDETLRGEGGFGSTD